METISMGTHKANKEHTCFWCGLTINKGETYNRSFNRYEGMTYEWKNHIICSELVGFYEWDYSGDGVTEDDFKECVSEEYDTIMSKHFNEEWESEHFNSPNFAGKRMFLIDYMNKQLTTK